MKRSSVGNNLRLTRRVGGGRPIGYRGESGELVPHLSGRFRHAYQTRGIITCRFHSLLFSPTCYKRVNSDDREDFRNEDSEIASNRLITSS